LNNIQCRQHTKTNKQIKRERKNITNKLCFTKFIDEFRNRSMATSDIFYSNTEKQSKSWEIKWKTDFSIEEYWENRKQRKRRKWFVNCFDGWKILNEYLFCLCLICIYVW